MLFKVGVFLVCGFAIFTLISAIYVHISYYFIKKEQRKGL